MLSSSTAQQVHHLLLELLSVGGPLSSEQVERAVSRITKPLQLLLPVSLLCCLYGPLLLGGPLMGQGGWLAPTQHAQVGQFCAATMPLLWL